MSKGSARDIIRLERLLALERMASAVTHDFNNDLAIIAGVTDLLLGDGRVVPTPEQERLYLQLIRRAAADATALIGRLRAFHRPNDDPATLHTFDLASVVAEAVSACKAKLADTGERRSDILVTWDPTTSGFVHGNSDDLRQATIEVLLNAVEASPPTTYVRVSYESRPGEIRLLVQDDGEGMPPDVVDRCFEPLFTTRHGHGRGMGLAVVYGTVRRHGGTASIDSQPGAGTTVTISLPSAATSTDLKSASDELKADRPLRVLVVDDNPSVRAVVEAFLVGDGHAVDLADNARDALVKVQTRGYDLVLTDQSMPGQSGGDLAVTLKRFNPTVPVIVMTGFDLDRDEIAPSGAVDGVVRKPLTLATLREVLALAASRPPE